MARKFFKQMFTVVVLCQEEALGPDTDLEDIGRLSQDERILAVVNLNRAASVTSKEMAELLTKFNSEPAFFDLDKEGKDLEEKQ